MQFIRQVKTLCMILHVMTSHVKGNIRGTNEGTRFWKILIVIVGCLRWVGYLSGTRMSHSTMPNKFSFITATMMSSMDIWPRLVWGLRESVNFYSRRLERTLLQKTFSHLYNFVTFSLQIGMLFCASMRYFSLTCRLEHDESTNNSGRASNNLEIETRCWKIRHTHRPENDLFSFPSRNITKVYYCITLL